MEFTNPVVSGFYPDPSVCYADGYFYLVCSSFEYFPGLPLFRSKNLTDWEQIGHVLTRKSQLDLTGAVSSEGLFAPTIRYHEGRFYVVVTNKTGAGAGSDGNFYVYTDDIEGEWSEPVRVDREGIDPSLLFDDDGKVYFMSNGEDDFGESGISVCEIDIATGKLLTKARCISKGTGGRFIEAPHLYHIGEYYYLLVAEGGTEYGHMECILKSKDIYGPYEGCPDNPILTNRNLGGHIIQAAGHADLVEDETGQWWMVHLAFRQIHKWRTFHHLGRETYLVPVFWTEDGWLKVGADGTSRSHFMLEDGKCSILPDAEYPSYHWKLVKEEACFLRCPDYENYKFIDEMHFAIKGVKDSIGTLGNISFVGMRQKEFSGVMEVAVDTKTMSVGQQAGITAYLSEANHYDIFVEKTEENCIVSCVLYMSHMPVYMDKVTVLLEAAGVGGDTGMRQNTGVDMADGNVHLKIQSDSMSYTFFTRKEDGTEVNLGSADSKYLSSEVAEGFTGVVLAAYAGADANGDSDFVQFTVL